jgi:hypothetical protein
VVKETELQGHLYADWRIAYTDTVESSLSCIYVELHRQSKAKKKVTARVLLQLFIPLEPRERRNKMQKDM